MRSFWKDKRVLVTGHTGFKGTWLSHWLSEWGAKVSGYSLPPESQPNLFTAARTEQRVTSFEGDVRNLDTLRSVFRSERPEIVFHLAAQALVLPSYESPVETYSTNVMGTVHVLEAIRLEPGCRAAVVVTSDKSYENREWVWGYRENEPMGGRDPYSSSKGCAELVTAAYRSSFFRDQGAPRVASVRAGNVIGGGDWAVNRLVPDIMRAWLSGQKAEIRNPQSVRPWQHVLDPLSGYLLLAAKLWDDASLAEAWNFGPPDEDVHTVGAVVRKLAGAWGEGAEWIDRMSEQPHEARHLKLDCSKARSILGWSPRLSLTEALRWTASWYKRFGAKPEDVPHLLTEQIHDYEALD